MARAELVLATWNVHAWVGSDGVRSPERAFEVIRELDADIVALQEAKGADWQRVAEQADYRPARAKDGEAQPLTRANALLLRPPLERIRTHDLSVRGREPRCALDAVVRVDGRPLRVVSTHLGLRARERRHQAARLAWHLEADDPELPLVVLGDLNDWTPWARQLRPLVRVVGALSSLRTFPSARPVLPLDRVGCRIPGAGAKVSVVRSPAASRASDHLPLRIELEATAAL